MQDRKVIKYNDREVSKYHDGQVSKLQNREVSKWQDREVSKLQYREVSKYNACITMCTIIWEYTPTCMYARTVAHTHIHAPAPTATGTHVYFIDHITQPPVRLNRYTHNELYGGPGISLNECRPITRQSTSVAEPWCRYTGQ